MRQARDRQRESIALSGSNPGKSVANIFHHRSSSKRGHELPPLPNDNKVFLTDDTDKAELLSAFFAKHFATESDPNCSHLEKSSDMFDLFFPGGSSSFSTSYRCYPHTFSSRKVTDTMEYGGKILLPPSALEHLTRLNVQYPMLFKLTNKKASRHTHCGVLEFVADEGMCYVPYWMLRNLHLEEGDMVHVKSVALPVATFAKFQPQDESFLDIFNPKAVLENALRDFACLTVGDMIAINYNERVYELQVLAAEPAEAVSIIECDMSVDFAPPVGYVEKRIEEQKKAVAETNIEENENIIPTQTQGFQIFGGSGSRLDGRSCEPSTSGSTSTPSGSRITQRGIPNYDYKPGNLKFLRMGNKVTTEHEDVSPKFKPFEGEGTKLKQSGAKAAVH
ncbi:Ubiquitin recognition factor in ER-associated degradation protein 1 [Sparganum proliferum]